MQPDLHYGLLARPVMTRRVAMVVGDTAGHVLPAIAVAEAYTEIAPGTEVSFIAAAGAQATTVVDASGYALLLVPASPLMRVGVRRKLLGAVQVGHTVTAARNVLQRIQARLVIGTGGYATGGVVLAARSLGLRTAIIEANVVPGLANRLLSRVAHRCYVAFDEAATYFPRRRVLSTGWPVRASIARLAAAAPPSAPRRPAGLLVTSGSRGDAFLGAFVPSLAAALKDAGLEIEVRHLSGALEPESIGRAYAAAGVNATVTPFAADMADAYARADVVVSRAGAGTLAELAIAGIPALLVPLGDAAADHQAFNARVLQDRGAALMVREREWNTMSVARALANVLRSPQRWKTMADAMRTLARPDAARDVVRDCETAMDGRW